MIQPDLIFDVGLHRGEDTAYYLAKGFRVVAFEADPDLAAACRQRFADRIAAGRLTVVEGALVPDHHDGACIIFYRNLDNSAFGTVDGDWNARNAALGTRSQTIEVPALRFSGQIARFGVPHYAKIDIEGLDLDCVAAFRNAADVPDYLSFESSKISLDAVACEIDLLCTLGYDAFAAVQQMDVRRRRVPIVGADGRTATWRFPPGASGPFGPDLDADWHDRAGILDRYRRIFALYRRFGDDTVWQRNTILRRGTRLFHMLTGQALPGWYDTHARISTRRGRADAIGS